jgi:hypothetical protein
MRLHMVRGCGSLSDRYTHTATYMASFCKLRLCCLTAIAPLDAQTRSGGRLVAAPPWLHCAGGHLVVWLQHRLWCLRRWPLVAEPLELFRFKCADHRYTGDMISTHFKRNNLMVCRVTSRWNHQIPDRTSVPCMKASPEIQSPSHFYNIGTNSYYKSGSGRVLQT